MGAQSISESLALLVQAKLWFWHYLIDVSQETPIQSLVQEATLAQALACKITC